MLHAIFLEIASLAYFTLFYGQDRVALLIVLFLFGLAKNHATVWLWTLDESLTTLL